MVTGEAAVSERVIQTVADHSGRDPLGLPPLYDTIDADALDTLVAGMDNGQVSFTYVGYPITIESDESIHLGDRPIESTTAERGVSGD